MSGRPWTPEEEDTLTRMSHAGATLVEMSDAIGRKIGAINNKRRDMRLRGTRAKPVADPPPPPEELEAMARSAGAVRQPQAPVVTSKWNDDTNVADLWAKAEEANAKHITKALERDKFEVDFPADEPIAIAFVSDQHITANAPVDLARMRADAEYIRDTRNLYALLLGDGVDNHIKHRAAMISSGSNPTEQYLMFEYYLSIFAPKILALCSGNHCHWTKQFSGVDVIDYIVERQRLCYSPHAFSIRATVGEYPYSLVCRHQYRFNSSYNQTHSPKQLWRFGEVDFDIGAVGHHHEPATEDCVMRGVDRWVCRPGSYQICSDYSRQYGYNSTYPTCPTVILWPRSRKITGFKDMRDAGHHLRSLLR